MRIAVRGSGDPQGMQALARDGTDTLIGGFDHEIFFDAHWPSAEIVGVGEWTAEYVSAEGVAALFQAADLTGLERRPVLHPAKDELHPGVVQLFSSEVLSPRVLDPASPEIDSPFPEERGFDAMGALCYAPGVLEAAADFNRTGEACAGFELPDWVVSAAVRRCLVERKLRGWSFEPVLRVDSPDYAAYVALWESLFALLEE